MGDSMTPTLGHSALNTELWRIKMPTSLHLSPHLTSLSPMSLILASHMAICQVQNMASRTRRINLLSLLFIDMSDNDGGSYHWRLDCVDHFLWADWIIDTSISKILGSLWFGKQSSCLEGELSHLKIESTTSFSNPTKWAADLPDWASKMAACLQDGKLA